MFWKWRKGEKIDIVHSLLCQRIALTQEAKGRNAFTKE